MKIKVEVSLDEYYNSLSQDLKQRIQNEIEDLFRGERRSITHLTAPSTPRGFRQWTRDGGEGPLVKPDRIIKLVSAPKKRGVGQTAWLELHKRGQDTWLVQDLLDLLTTHGADKNTAASILATMWSRGYIDTPESTPPQ